MSSLTKVGSTSRSTSEPAASAVAGRRRLLPSPPGRRRGEGSARSASVVVAAVKRNPARGDLVVCQPASHECALSPARRCDDQGQRQHAPMAQQVIQARAFYRLVPGFGLNNLVAITISAVPATTPTALLQQFPRQRPMRTGRRLPHFRAVLARPDSLKTLVCDHIGPIDPPVAAYLQDCLRFAAGPVVSPSSRPGGSTPPSQPGTPSKGEGAARGPGSQSAGR